MSGYTIGEIVVWLVLTAVLGFALGWLTRELLHRRRKAPAAPAVVIAAPATATEPARQSEPAPEPELELDLGLAPAVEAGPHPGSAVPLPGGAAPAPEFVVKVSRGSKIYHAPTSPAYGRTTAAIWFVSPEAAEVAGFRKPKNG